MSSPAQQLRVGEHLLQPAVVADAECEDRLSRVVGKMPGYSRWEGQHHLSCDFDNTPGTPGGGESKGQSLNPEKSFWIVELDSAEKCELTCWDLRL